MDFSDIEEKKSELSTGKSEPEKPVPPKPVTPATGVAYDKNKADLEYISELSSKLPYVQRAIDYVKQHGYSLAVNLKQALVDRANGLKSITMHEADIVYRAQNDISSEFFWTSLQSTNSQIVADTIDFEKGLYQLRARYNVAVDWQKNKMERCTPEQKERGLRRMRIIILSLEEIGQPIHEEEAVDGFHREFLKPEHLNHQQAAAAMLAHRDSQSIESRERWAALERLAVERMECTH